MEVLNKGHFGSRVFCPLFGGCPLVGGSVMGGSTVLQKNTRICSARAIPFSRQGLYNIIGMFSSALATKFVDTASVYISHSLFVL